ncbi:uncharacterized protein LAJ45_06862 [Morchella importuna]|uniref:uncharacterized protein n=1 Tax=Morchella importuna TaxID=1174673 RepID=UPI001E8DA163|nr:uncharacterized protein LAJ45_06862 [Morchella importuna]KAH8149322.1 hypothetical protein LAJ45_06862 [Morchella importuna]
MRIKLLGNADRFPTLQSKLSYAFSRLEGVAANQFLQYVGEEGIALPSMLRFYEILDTAFGDPDRMRTARRNLRNIRQRNRTFADYFAEFQRYAAESGMDEVSRIEALMEGINAELDESMIHHETPTTKASQSEALSAQRSSTSSEHWKSASSGRDYAWEVYNKRKLYCND